MATVATGSEEVASAGKHRPAGKRGSRSSPVATATIAAMTATLVVALIIGWRTRDSGRLTPATGLGYALGIVGGVCMLLLLLYPLRKRLSVMRDWGRAAHWFRAHMILGVIGPALIVFHANFGLGALNSNIALLAMLLVAASGLVGRYFYARTHYGLYGQLATVQELQADVDAARLGLDLGEVETAALRNRLDRLTAGIMAPRRGLGDAAWHAILAEFTSRHALSQLRRHLRHAIAAEGKRLGWRRGERRKRIQQIDRQLTAYSAALRKAAQFRVYERLFALWHILHVPFFVLLVLSAIAHVVAVHLY